MSNDYFRDSAYFLRSAADKIRENMNKEDVVSGALFFSLGIERILKGILYDLNPIYIYKSPDFKNSVCILYKERLLPNFKKNRDISKKPNEDVLGFRSALSRAMSISKIAAERASLLFALSNIRDIVATIYYQNSTSKKPRRCLLEISIL